MFVSNLRHRWTLGGRPGLLAGGRQGALPCCRAVLISEPGDPARATRARAGADGPARRVLGSRALPDARPRRDRRRAMSNVQLLERDRMFTELLREETKRLELPAIEIDASMTEDDLAERVTETFGL